MATEGSTVTIYGASDDLIEIVGDAPGCDEYNPVSDGRPESFVLTAPEGQVRIRVSYTGRGVWAIEASPIDEGADGPVVSIALSGYTAIATVHGVTSVIHESPSSQVGS